MKNFIAIMAFLSTMLLATSCSSDSDGDGTGGDNKVTVDCVYSIILTSGYDNTTDGSKSEKLQVLKVYAENLLRTTQSPINKEVTIKGEGDTEALAVAAADKKALEMYNENLTSALAARTEMVSNLVAKRGEFKAEIVTYESKYKVRFFDISYMVTRDPVKDSNVFKDYENLKTSDKVTFEAIGGTQY